MENFNPHDLNKLKTLKEKKEYIGKYFFICDNGKVYFLRRDKYIEVDEEAMRKYFRTVKPTMKKGKIINLLDWFMFDNDYLYFYEDLPKIKTEEPKKKKKETKKKEESEEEPKPKKKKPKKKEETEDTEIEIEYDDEEALKALEDTIVEPEPTIIEQLNGKKKKKKV